MISVSSPFAVKTPHSLAANSGKAVMVNPALDILTLMRRSWDSPLAGKFHKTAVRAITAGMETRSECKRLLLLIGFATFLILYLVDFYTARYKSAMVRRADAARS